MNPDTTFERQLQGWLAAEASSRAPAGLHDMVMERARTTRQHPGWLVSLRWGAFPSPAGVISRPAARSTYLLVVLGLVLALIAVAIAAGAFRSQPARVLGWTATGSMIEVQAGAGRGGTATLLPSGKVLVTGPASPVGIDPNSVDYWSSVDWNFAELYDPASGTWSATGKMIMPRATGGTFTATLLRTGMVLMTGGDFGWFTPQLYDPASGTWTVTGNMIEPHHGTATLLRDGKVLVAGGSNAGAIQASAEVYDADTGTWSVTGSMTTGRDMHAATVLLDGRVLVVGGMDGSTGDLATAELYDPASGTWTATGSMATAPGPHTAVTLLRDGKVLAVAGGTGDTPLASAELYDPASGTWTATGSMIYGQWWPVATELLDGKVLVAGGNYAAAPLATAELYDPATGTWTATASMGTPRAAFAATLLLDGRVLVAGGGPNGTAAELYDPVGPPGP